MRFLTLAPDFSMPVQYHRDRRRLTSGTQHHELPVARHVVLRVICIAEKIAFKQHEWSASTSLRPLKSAAFEANPVCDFLTSPKIALTRYITRFPSGVQSGREPGVRRENVAFAISYIHTSFCPLTFTRHRGDARHQPPTPDPDPCRSTTPWKICNVINMSVCGHHRELPSSPARHSQTW